MAVETNGRLKGAPETNGVPKGKTAIRPQQFSKPRSSFTTRIMTIVTRLLLWYSLITVLFRCPGASDFKIDSPQVCKLYLTTRSNVTPFVQPYYNAYALPYVDKARSYVEKLDDNLFAPSKSFARRSYDQYGASWTKEASECGQRYWKNNLRPKIDTIQAEAQKQYELLVIPQLNSISAMIGPYYTAGRESLFKVYKAYLIPLYTTSRPYVEDFYKYGHEIFIETGLPRARSALMATSLYVDRTLWPKIRVLYGTNVEPQLVRIGERLGRYRDGKKLMEAVEDIDDPLLSSSLSPSLPSVSSSVYPTQIFGTSTPAISSDSAGQSSPAYSSPGEQIEQTREKIESDLRKWQDKFALAASKGTEDLQERIHEITERQIANQISGVGESLIIQLEEVSRSELVKLKKAINEIVSSLPSESAKKDLENAEIELSKSTRSAGLAVKEKAQALRTWKKNFEQETHSLVAAASKSTLEIIDNIRDLGLQEIGMRWAWMEGVTYKDWSHYHSLKKTFDQWRSEIEAVAQNHAGLQKSIEAGNILELRGMNLAEKAATELSRVKEVGKWKINAADASDNFETRKIPAVAALAGQKVIEKVDSASERIFGTSQNNLETLVSQVTEEGTKFASIASSRFIGTEVDLGEKASSKVSAARSSASSFVAKAVNGNSDYNSDNLVSEIFYTASSSPPTASEASKKVFAGAMAQQVKEQKPIFDDPIADDKDATYSDKIQDIADEAGSQYSDTTRAVKDAFGKSSNAQDLANIVSLADMQYSSAIAAASKALYGEQTGKIESVAVAASEKYSAAIAAASSVIYGTSTPAIQSYAAEASSTYSDAVSRAQAKLSEASSAASARITGPPKPVHEKIWSSIENIYSESVDAASSRLKSALDAASTVVYGQPPSPRESVLAAAEKKYSEAVAAALSQYDIIKSAVNKHSGSSEGSYFSGAEQQYSSVYSTVSSQLSSATKAPSQGILESISVLASSKLADGLSLASARYSSVKTAIGATPTAAYQHYAADAQRQYYEAIGIAYERYSDFITAASDAVYGSPTPVHESLYSVASASLYGTPIPAYQSIVNAAQSQYDLLASQASDNFQKALDSAASVTGETSKSLPQNLLDSASSKYNAALSIASASFASATDAASISLFGTSSGKLESATSVVAEKASSVSSLLHAQAVETETPWSDSVASRAAENWQALVTKASHQVYGAPTPFAESIREQASNYGAQVSNAAVANYEAVQAIFLEMIQGKEPDFTESVISRLSSVYHTGYHATLASSASSYASDTFASASSAISSVFTPPPALEAIISAANNHINAAVDAASLQYHGSSKGTYEKATSAAASSYSSVQSAVSEAIYGAPPGFMESLSSSFEDVAISAQNAISAAIYSTSTAASASATDAAGEAYASASSFVKGNVDAASSAVRAATAKISEAVYGPEQGAIESAVSRLSAAVESAKARVAEIPRNAGDAYEKAKNSAEDLGSSVADATQKLRDEL